jgi:Fic family protein
VTVAHRILALIEEDRQRITNARSAASVLLIFQQAQTDPILSVQHASKRAGVSFPTASRAFESLTQLGIMREITGKARGRIYAYGRYLDLLSEGTEPLPR